MKQVDEQPLEIVKKARKPRKKPARPAELNVGGGHLNERANARRLRQLTRIASRNASTVA